MENSWKNLEAIKKIQPHDFLEFLFHSFSSLNFSTLVTHSGKVRIDKF